MGTVFRAQERRRDERGETRTLLSRDERVALFVFDRRSASAAEISQRLDAAERCLSEGDAIIASELLALVFRVVPNVRLLEASALLNDTTLETIYDAEGHRMPIAEAKALQARARSLSDAVNAAALVHEVDLLAAKLSPANADEVFQQAGYSRARNVPTLLPRLDDILRKAAELKLEAATTAMTPAAVLPSLIDADPSALENAHQAAHRLAYDLEALEQAKPAPHILARAKDVLASYEATRVQAAAADQARLTQVVDALATRAGTERYADLRKATYALDVVMHYGASSDQPALEHLFARVMRMKLDDTAAALQKPGADIAALKKRAEESRYSFAHLEQVAAQPSAPAEMAAEVAAAKATFERITTPR